MIPTSSLPSTPRRSPKKKDHHETVSPYFSRVLTTSPSSSSSPISKKTPSHNDDIISFPSKSALCGSDFIDDETYVAYGVSVQLLKDPLYAFNLRKFTHLYSVLWQSKPRLIQGKLHALWWPQSAQHALIRVHPRERRRRSMEIAHRGDASKQNVGEASDPSILGHFR